MDHFRHSRKHSMSSGVALLRYAKIFLLIALFYPYLDVLAVEICAGTTGNIQNDSFGLDETVTCTVTGAILIGPSVSLTDNASVRLRALNVSIEGQFSVGTGAILEIQSSDIGDSGAVSHDLLGSLAFLVYGADAPQQGFEPDSVDGAHASALRGRALLPGGAPLAGVTVSVARHPEWGTTTTLPDGSWTMLVGGGATLVAEFRLDGHVTVQRAVVPAWNDWANVDNVVLTPLDDAVTTVNLPAVTTLVHTSSTTADGDGSRAASLLFRSGTSATMTLPNGSTQPLGTLDVRATEVTVGDTGPSAMPGELPLGSLYTYAVDVTVDQAEAASATHIDFDQPVTLWIDNFLGFPAGTPAPVGYYDRELAAWVALDEQGLVVGVIDVDGTGIALLDVDGDSDSDNDDLTAGAAIGIDDAERAAVGARHAAGDSIVRVRVDHFTPFDLNWLPADETEPGEEADPEDDDRQDDETCEGGASSIIACNNGTLLEMLDVVGAPGPLVYDSQRAIGRLANRTVSIPITGALIPTTLEGVKVTVDIAGQRFVEYVNTLAPNDKIEYVWDGLDAFGRPVTGATAVTVTHTELHRQYYATGPFGVPPTSGAASTGVPTRQLTPLVTTWRGSLVGIQRPAGETVGGWTFPQHHRYDPVSSTLHRGDGSDRTVRSIDRYTATWRLTGTDNQGPGNPSLLTSPDASGVAVLADGSVVLAAASEHLVYRITPDGVLDVLAGTGASGDGGDGDDPLAATFIEPVAVAAMPDGTVLVVDAGAGRVRRIGNTIEPFAGAPAGAGTNGEGIPAVDANLNRPVSVAVAPDGVVLIADAGTGLVLRVGADGLITTFAGGGATTVCPTPCARDELDLTGLSDVATSANGQRVAIAAGGMAHQMDVGGRASQLDIPMTIDQIAYSPDGGLWIGNSIGTGLIRKDGSLFQPNFDLEGSGRRTGPLGGSSTGLAVDARDLVVTPLGDVLIVDGAVTGSCEEGCEVVVGGGIDGVMVMTAPLRSHDAAGLPPFGPQVRPGPLTSGAVHLVPSADGSQIYLFDSSGRHLRTVDSKTFVVIAEFGYDDEGNLASVTKSNGRVTTVERNGNGDPTAIEGPDGHRTTIVTTGGLITASTDPLNRSRTFHYLDGLLVGHTDLAGNQATYTYDRGLLVGAVATDGTVFTITENEVTGGHATTVNTGGLEQMITENVVDEFGLWSSTIQTFPDGSQRSVDASVDGARSMSDRDGSVLMTEDADDPRFGGAARYTDSWLIFLGDRYVSDFYWTTSDLVVSQTDPADPFSVTSIVRVTTADQAIWTTAFDPIARTIVVTDPEGFSVVQTYDAAGLVVEVDRPGGLADTTTTYDAAGRMVSSTTGGRITTSVHDTDGNLVAETSPGGQLLTGDHDAVGRLTSRSIAGVTTTFVHHDLNVLTGWTTPEGVAHSATVTPGRQLETRTGPPNPITGRVYDNARRPTSVDHGDGTSTTVSYTGGKVTWVDGPEVDVDILYPAGYEPGTTIATPDRATWTASPSTTIDVINVVRDLDVRQGLPVSVEVSYDRDGDGVALVSHHSNQRWEHLLLKYREVDYASSSRIDLAYDLARHLVTEGPWAIDRSVPAGLTTTYSATPTVGGGTFIQSFEADQYGGFMTRTLDVDGATIGRVEVVTDDDGRIVERRIIVDGSTVLDQRYGHDGRGFLTTVTDPTGAVLEVYEYDDDGNRTGSMVATTFDNNGMMSSIHGWTLDHAVTGGLLVASDGQTTVYYGYDDAGRRVARQVGTDVTMYLYGDPGHPGRVTDVVSPDGTLTQYLYDDVGHVYAMRRDGVWYGVLSDQVGSPILVVDQTGAVLDRRVFDTWGALVSDTNPAFELELGFAGGLHDPETGFIRFGRRDYDPNTARWLSPDPAHLAGGSINLYRYAENDPFSNRDSSGRLTFGGSAIVGGGYIVEVTVTSDGYSACGALGGGFDVGPIIDLTGDHESAGQGAQLSGSLGPVSVDVPLESGNGGSPFCAPEVDVPFTSDPFAANDILELMDDLFEDGVKGLVKGAARGVAASANYEWCSGMNAW